MKKVIIAIIAAIMAVAFACAADEVGPSKSKVTDDQTSMEQSAPEKKAPEPTPVPEPAPAPKPEPRS